MRPARLPPPPVAPVSAEEKAKAFIASFDGGECFLIEPLPGATKPHEYQAVGRAIEPFRRFDSAYKREVGVEADLTMAPITAEQCPALDLVRLAAPDGRQPPRLALKTYEVGPGQPLMGTISNLEGRRLYLVLVDNDGLVHRLDAKVDASGDSATFSIPLTADASSVGPMQMLLAIVSDKPIPALDTLHSANLKSIASRLIDDARRRVRLSRSGLLQVRQLTSAKGTPRRTTGRDSRSIRLDFLGPSPFRCEHPRFMRVGFPWISLDFLVRIETYQWVTRDFRENNFHAPSLASRAPEREPAVKAMRKGGIVHGASLPIF